MTPDYRTGTDACQCITLRMCPAFKLGGDVALTRMLFLETPACGSALLARFGPHVAMMAVPEELASGTLSCLVLIDL